jgi:hypothetical protein
MSGGGHKSIVIVGDSPDGGMRADISEPDSVVATVRGFAAVAGRGYDP